MRFNIMVSNISIYPTFIARKPFTRSLSDQHYKESTLRPKTLPMVRQGSLHNRSRSVGDIDRLIPLRNSIAVPSYNGQVQDEPIEQWRSSVSHAGDPRFSLMGHDATMRVSPRTDSEGSSHSVTEGARHEVVFSRPTSSPAAYRQPSPSLGGMNMMYYQMQQQHQQHQQQQQLQLQLQAQQQAQIQQYHNAAQARQAANMHLQTPASQHRRKSANRLSVSGMDLLIQRENEKAETTRKPKRIDPSKASIDGMLGRLPESGTHNINFQTGNIPNKRNWQ